MKSEAAGPSWALYGLLHRVIILMQRSTMSAQPLLATGKHTTGTNEFCVTQAQSILLCRLFDRIAALIVPNKRTEQQQQGQSTVTVRAHRNGEAMRTRATPRRVQGGFWDLVRGYHLSGEALAVSAETSSPVKDTDAMTQGNQIPETLRYRSYRTYRSYLRLTNPPVAEG